ncbi:GNAT family N-acetyltransferase [Shewanella donghaensis]|uniref:GNAT family N-acetyltransferase n=1 Tax=Shewanella donghaensis TaxID=238836 RepID=UPI001183F610|nr:GNAT family N-acetyltransferase [Shewanella donghaensis]
MIELFTERLKIRSISQSDWNYFNDLHQDKEVMKFITEVSPLSEIKAKFESRLLPWSFESGNWLTLVIEDVHTGCFVGLTGFHCDDNLLRRAEVGYIISPNAAGKGYGTESLKAVIDWGIHQFDIHKFIGICATKNTASAKVMLNCGFMQEGCLRQNYKIGKHWVDEFVFGLLSNDIR